MGRLAELRAAAKQRVLLNINKVRPKDNKTRPSLLALRPPKHRKTLRNTSPPPSPLNLRPRGLGTGSGDAARGPCPPKLTMREKV